MKDGLGQSFDFQNRRPQLIKNIRRHRWCWTICMDGQYVCVQVHVRGRVKQSMVQCTMDGGEKGRDVEMKKKAARGVTTGFVWD
jgi:hypothetical protein